MTQVPRWLLVAALVFAPWAYGATRAWAVEVLNVLLGAMLGAWLLGCVLRRSWPKVPRGLWIPVGCLVLQAWWMVGNAKFDYAPDSDTVMGFSYDRRFALEPLAVGAPGSYHKSFSIPVAVRLTLLLGVVCLVADLVRRFEWRRRVLQTMIWTGVSLVALGLVQRFTHAPAIFWRDDPVGNYFFATYRYHANAGAYLNLVWPLLAGVLVGYFPNDGRRVRKVVWAGAWILCLAGVLVNTSRGAALVAIALLGIWCVWLARQTYRGRFIEVHFAVVGVTMLLLLVISGGVAVFAGVDASLHRWSHSSDLVSGDNQRWLASGVCWGMLPEAGLWGFGPGTFRTMFPYFTNPLGKAISGVWLHAHQDYLETLIEWGYAGGLLWAVVVLGGIVRGWRTVVRQADTLAWRKRALHFGIFTAISGVLFHAFVDFPLQVASIQLYVAVLLGWLWGSAGWLSERRERAVPDRSAPIELDGGRMLPPQEAA